MTLIKEVHFIRAVVWSNVGASCVLTVLQFVLSSPARGQTWTQTSAPTNGWGAVTCSADGRIIAAGSQVICLSTNYGLTWITNDQTAFSSWNAIVASADGMCLAAADAGYGVITSTNMGLNWRSNSINAGSYGSLACSADGSVMALVSGSGATVYFSTNFGDTWFSNSPPAPPAPYLYSLNMSADGKTIVASGGSTGATFIMSTNQGQDWIIQCQPPDGHGGRIIAASVDCISLAAAGGNCIYTSTNTGITWRSNGFPVQPQWLSVAGSADGRRLAAANYFGWIFSTTNSGADWISNSVPRLNWFSVASSADGRRLMATGRTGVWTCYLPGVPALEVTAVNNQMKISWLIPSTEFVLEESTNPSSINWKVVSAVPTINTSNLHYEVSVPIAESNAFFRLRMR